MRESQKHMNTPPINNPTDVKTAIAWLMIRLIGAGWARPRILKEGGAAVEFTDLGRDRLVQVDRFFNQVGWLATPEDWVALRELSRAAHEEAGE